MEEHTEICRGYIEDITDFFGRLFFHDPQRESVRLPIGEISETMLERLAEFRLSEQRARIGVPAVRLDTPAAAPVEESIGGILRPHEIAGGNLTVLPTVVIGDLVLEDLGQPGALAGPAGIPIPGLEGRQESLLHDLLGKFPATQSNEGEPEEGVAVKIHPFLRIGGLVFRIVVHGER